MKTLIAFYEIVIPSGIPPAQVEQPTIQWNIRKRKNKKKRREGKKGKKRKKREQERTRANKRE